MKNVTATVANRQFSSILNKAAKGEEFTITSRGKPIARLLPVDAEEERRAEARKRLFARIEKQPLVNIKIDWTREDLYERDF